MTCPHPTNQTSISRLWLQTDSFVKKGVFLMNVCIVGTGYVGLTTAAVLAELGHQVCCVDQNHDKIEQLNRGYIPIYEPNLKEIIEKNRGRLTFTNGLDLGIKHASIVIICVGTPSLTDGRTDLTYIQSAIDHLALHIDSYKTIIIKSTVPPGTTEQLYIQLLEKGVPNHLFSIAANPEFLREGSAIFDMLHADKIVIGLRPDDQRSLPIMKSLYAGISCPYVITSLTGAEMIKYASNAFLATKISFINEMARICDAVGANIHDVAKGIGYDPRIGPHFLQAGLGYGGSCFPKDVKSLEQVAHSQKITPHLLQAVQLINDSQVDLYIQKLQQAVNHLSDQTIAVLGIAFKPNTDDTRHSPAEHLIRKLSEAGCIVRAYDPKAKLDSSHQPNVTQTDTLQEAVEGADILIIATDWQEFQQLNWREIKAQMNGPIVLDARNCLRRQDIEQWGLQYIGVGCG
jgi:UDPglucose 6-dehydrogenase